MSPETFCFVEIEGVEGSQGVFWRDEFSVTERHVEVFDFLSVSFFGHENFRAEEDGGFGEGEAFFEIFDFLQPPGFKPRLNFDLNMESGSRRERF